MPSARQTIPCKPIVYTLASLLSLTGMQAQENSPYSRYGLGDPIPYQNVLNRAMGGMAIAYADLQSVNSINPASYANLKLTTFDIGVDISNRTLRSLNPLRKYTSRYMIPTYIQLGLPLSKKGFWGMNFGLRPVSRISYNISTRTRLTGIDSVLYNHTGTGGAYQAFIGTGIGTKNFSVGINAGYMFGNKLYNTRIIFLNDSIPYRKTNAADTTRFGGLFLEGGFMYRIRFSDKYYLRIGGTGSLENRMRAVRDLSRETFEFNANTGTDVVDSITRSADNEGTIVYPKALGGALMFESTDQWSFGVELNKNYWGDYRYYGEADNLKNTWTFRTGGQFTPDINGKRYFERVMYRFGFSYGPDLVDPGREMNRYMASLGMGLPVRRNFYTNQFTSINITAEVGARGTKQNNIRENLFRLSVGMNLSDIWFNPRKYD